MVTLLTSCLNPFAPKLSDDASDGTSVISDRKTIEGVFQNLQYAYTFKDTLIYGELLNSDFVFSYRDYDKGVDVSWGRDEEMDATFGLFANSQRLDLVWNNILTLTSDSTGVVRSFNLTVTFNPTDVIFVDGRVNMKLKKDSQKKWQLVRWLDESNF
ncbi:MAG: hypothetical protein K9J12_07855 [Melioribacteraceae bacterium]|nr:hypothetical protein [Melioribacteraceae bacterium]MCF8265186.1 hypothetical protein [Melioribacteraceae bacterium]MCF8413757.1 hypothetical protein [Melioribacteraceae bacterium]MCF8431131.1 hypothetical protein [Melioribacteraceae bacterium]